MHGNDHNKLVPPTSDRVAHALGAFWRGSADEFDQIVSPSEGEEIGICRLLRLVALALRFDPSGFWMPATDRRSSRITGRVNDGATHRV